MQREYDIFKRVATHYGVMDRFTINGFGDGNICIEQENPNYTVKVRQKDGLLSAMSIHLNLCDAFINALHRVGADDAVLNFKELCGVFIK